MTAIFLPNKIASTLFSASVLQFTELEPYL